jgi:hypothetical protein
MEGIFAALFHFSKVFFFFSFFFCFCSGVSCVDTRVKILFYIRIVGVFVYIVTVWWWLVCWWQFLCLEHIIVG